jgi:hypothetical protein
MIIKKVTKPYDAELTALCEVFGWTRRRAMANRTYARSVGVDVWKQYGGERPATLPERTPRLVEPDPNINRTIVYQLKDGKWEVAVEYAVKRYINTKVTYYPQ